MKVFKYKIEISSEINCICGLVTGILEFIEKSSGHVDPCVEFEIKVILNELVLNAIKHGNNCDPAKKVKASVTITNDGYMTLLVEDEGQGYDYGSNCNNCSDDLFELKETGRGIFIVSNLCESLKFNKKGNRVIAVKKL